MNVHVWKTSDASNWRQALDRAGGGDAYFLPEYFRAYEENGDGEGLAFTAEEGGESLFHAFMLRPITKVGDAPVKDGWTDIETVYGYGGPLASTREPGALAALWEPFSAWCRERRVVAEFLRFHPLLGNQAWAEASCRVTLDRETVAIDLSGDEDSVLRRFPAGQGTQVRQALAHGLACRETPLPEGLDVFRPLYERAMVRAGALSYYGFSDAYFNSLVSGLREKVRSFTVWDGKRSIASALFLAHGSLLHYHLSGSDESYLRLRPNNLLIHTAALWGRSQGFRWLHLGGGRTNKPDDTLLAFKASLSRNRFPFHVGRRVHDSAVYERLCALWMRGQAAAERPPYFLLYRLGGAVGARS